MREVTLLGQNVNAWRGRIEGDPADDFAALLEYVAAIEGIERIRYTTSHPKEFTQRLIDAYGQIDKLVSHVHKSIIRRLRAARPGVSISSDFIVGFPGETDQDFAKTLKLIDDIGFDGSFNFVYSRRPGTPAADLPDDTPEAVKLERLQAIQVRIDTTAGDVSAASSSA